MRHGVTGVPQVRHASVSRSLRRSYAVGAATDAAMRPVSTMLFPFERAFRGAQRSTVRRETSRTCGAGTSPAPARLLGAAVRWEFAEQSCRVAVVREAHERRYRTLVRLKRVRVRAGWKI